MSYMDQGMDCKRCGTSHSNFGSGVCYSCEREEAAAKRKGEWDAKTPEEQALHHLESWANPTRMTFNKDDAKFVLGVFRACMALRQPGAVATGELEDPIIVPRGLLGAACHAITSKKDAPNTLAKLREFIWAKSAQPATAPVSQPAAQEFWPPSYRLEDGEKIFYSRVGQGADGLPFMTDSDQHGVWHVAMVFAGEQRTPKHVWAAPQPLSAPAGSEQEGGAA